MDTPVTKVEYPRRTLSFFGISIAVYLIYGGWTMRRKALSANALRAAAVTLLLTASAAADWPMAAANPQRTSWVPQAVTGNLRIEWCRPVEAFISQNINLIAANNKIYVASSRGLYALDAANGDLLWRFDRQIPLGNAPTVVGATIYVPGLDRKLYALDDTGTLLWTFQGAEAGFNTNPLVIDGVVYLGNRDGRFYAINRDNGQLIWKYPAAGQPRLAPIDLSAAYKDGVIYFAAGDCYAYALDTSGNLVWKSNFKMPGPHYLSFWPVIYRDKVVYSGANIYRNDMNPGSNSLPPGGGFNRIIKEEVWPEETYATNVNIGPSVPGYSEAWAHGKTVLDGSRVAEVLENDANKADWHVHHPDQRSTIFINRADGTEYTLDLDGDGHTDYAPLGWVGTSTGNRYPPIVNGSDDVIYQAALSGRTSGDFGMVRRTVFGWKMGTIYLSVVGLEDAGDEPTAISGGGDVVYDVLCCCRQGAWARLTGGSGLLWTYSNPIYDLLDVEGNPQQVAGLDIMWWGRSHLSGLHGNFGNHNGTYHDHGDQNPLIPYNGRLYVQRSNAVVCYGPGPKAPAALPILEMNDEQVDILPVPTKAQLLSRLEEEIQKIVDAGNLKPAYFPIGQWWYTYLQTHFENPGDTLMTLCRAYPHVNAALQAQLATYLQNQFSTYFSPTMYARKGWSEGVSRDWMDYPYEVANNMTSNKSTGTTDRTTFSYPPHNFYAMYLYAQIFPEQAATVYSRARSKLQVPCPGSNNDIQNTYRYEINMYITGYTGFLKLQEIAGMAVTDGALRAQVQNELNRLLGMRSSNFTKDSPFVNDDKTMPGGTYQCRTMNTSANFLYMCPELGDYMNQHAYNKAAQAVKEYNWVGAFWFISRYTCAPTEGVMASLYDVLGLFHAKAWILKEPYEELVKYLDSPTFKMGDLFYLDTLITAVEAEYAAPVIEPDGGETYVEPVTVTLSLPTAPDANIYYTLDGSEPNESGILYSAPFELTGNTTVKALAYPEGLTSRVATAVFVIDTGMANTAPIVDAGSNQAIQMPEDTVTLAGSVDDATLTWPVTEVTVSWTKVSGPGTVVFSDDEALATDATFSTYGVYVLRLAASEGALIASDEVTIAVVSKPNAGPTVDAGPDQAIVLPVNSVSLDGDIADDSLPDPPASVSSTWSVASGPGAVAFGNMQSADTTATFGGAGTYMLRLDANDGEYSAYDTVTVTVYPPVMPGVVAHLKLDEGAGAVASDSSGNGDDGAISGAGWTSGQSIGALSFDGVDDVVTIPNSRQFDCSRGTWSVWIKTDGNWGVDGGSAGTTAKGSCVVMDRHGTAVNSSSGIALLINPTGTVNLQAKGGSTIVANPKSTGTIIDNAWHHVAVKWDQAAGGQMLIYIDGSPDGSAANTAAWAFADQNTMIGDSPDTYWEEFAGRIDDVQIYNVVLSDGDIGMLYNNAGKAWKAGDINSSGTVDEVDLGMMAAQWLQTPGTPSGDICPPPSGDGDVDMLDFAVLANAWLD